MGVAEIALGGSIAERGMEYAEIAMAGRASVSIEISYKYGDVDKRNVKGRKLLTLKAELLVRNA